LKHREAGDGAKELNVKLMERPKLIPVDVYPIIENGEKLIGLRDPHNRDNGPVYVSELAFYILTLFDGNTSIDELIHNFKDKFDSTLDRGEIENLLNQLDNAMLIDNERYRINRSQIENKFLNSDVRDCFLCGLSYPEDINELDELINGFYKQVENSSSAVNGNLKGLISPHIDFRRGGVSYAIAYRELIEQADTDTYLIFGTSHYAQNSNPFILTKKSFSTPFGNVETDKDFIEKLEENCPWDLYEGEFFHRNEHSIEFQVIFLKHLLGDKKDFKIIPVLCNSFHDFVNRKVSPISDWRIKRFLDVLKETINEHSGSLLIIAGVDMAHVGPKFGDQDPVDDNTLSWIEQRDNLTLSFAEKIDPEGFYKSVEEEKDKRKICGLSSIYSLLNVIDAEKGKILNYDKALEPDTGSVVTFASAAFYK